MTNGLGALDVAALVLLGLLALRGLRDGVLVGMGGLLGFVAGGWLGFTEVAGLMQDVLTISLSEGVLLVGCTVLCALLGHAVGRRLGRAARGVVSHVPLAGGVTSALDCAAGAVFGLLMGAVIIWALTGLVLGLPLPDGLKTPLKHSQVVGAIEERAPEWPPRNALRNIELPPAPLAHTRKGG